MGREGRKEGKIGRGRRREEGRQAGRSSETAAEATTTTKPDVLPWIWNLSTGEVETASQRLCPDLARWYSP